MNLCGLVGDEPNWFVSPFLDKLDLILLRSTQWINLDDSYFENLGVTLSSCIVLVRLDVDGVP